MKKLTKTQKRQILKDKWFDRLLLAGMILFFSFAGWFAFNSYFRYDIYRERTLAKYENKQLEAGKICMYRDKLDLGPTIPVIIDGDTYYVCCTGCADKLKLNFQDSRFGVDEYSHHKVKKSSAFIVLSDKSKGKVRYFESENNFNQFNKIK